MSQLLRIDRTVFVNHDCYIEARDNGVSYLNDYDGCIDNVNTNEIKCVSLLKLHDGEWHVVIEFNYEYREALITDTPRTRESARDLMNSMLREVNRDVAHEIASMHDTLRQVHTELAGINEHCQELRQLRND